MQVFKFIVPGRLATLPCSLQTLCPFLLLFLFSFHPYDVFHLGMLNALRFLRYQATFEKRRKCVNELVYRDQNLLKHER